MLKKIEFENNEPYKIEIAELNGEKIHFHDAMEIMFIIKGSIYDHDYHRTQGQGIIYTPREIHSFTSNELSIVAKLYFNPQFFKVYKIQSINEIYYVDLNESKDPQDSLRLNNLRLKNLIVRILLLAYKDTSVSKKILLNLVSQVYHIFSQCYSEYSFYKNSKTELTQPLLDRYNRILDYLLENRNTVIQIPEIAKKEHISETRLSHFWKDITGEPLQTTLNALKAIKARELIVSSNLGLKDISELCGFSEKKYFYKYFKKLYGITPGEYRKRYFDKEHSEKYSQYPLKSRILSSEEAEKLINQYIIKYYNVDYELYSDIVPQQDIFTEKTLSDLLKAIQKNRLDKIKMVTPIKLIPNTILLSLNNIIYSEYDNYKINWEYLYIAVQYAIQNRLDIITIVDQEIMNKISQNNIFAQFQEEIYKIWGETLAITFNLIISVKKFYSYNESENLINIFKSKISIFTKIDLLYVL